MRVHAGNAGTIGGIILCAVIVTLVALAQLDVLEPAVERAAYRATELPEVHQLCGEVAVQDVARAIAVYSAAGWPVEPLSTMEEAHCPYEHHPAPPGVIRWHSCDSLRIGTDGFHFPPCTGEDGDPNKGNTYVGRPRDTGGEPVAGIDIYVRRDAPACTYAHELGHALGITGHDSHSEGVTVMGVPCGDSPRLLEYPPP